jgi:GTP cyclohydrolase I
MTVKITEKWAKGLLESVGLNLNEPGLKKTPYRIAKMYINELLAGLKKKSPGVTSFPNVRNYIGIVMSDCIEFWSICEHHFLPFGGMAWVLYIPENKLIGYSKFARIVDHFARRPQLQENLCSDVADYIVQECNVRGVMVYMRAKHGCTQCRGVKASSRSGLTTNVTKGVFQDSGLEEKGLQMIRISLCMEGI